MRVAAQIEPRIDAGDFGDGADGQIEHYVPSLPEVLLGLGGIGIAFLITAVGVRVLRFLPEDDFAKLEAAGHIME